jgi:uncharacterized membrane protein YcaP (DUF421 family)
MFELQTDPLEIVARVLLVYGGLYVLVRLSGKKEIGQLGPMDLLAMLLLSETVSPALTRQDDSVLTGWIAAATLLAASFVIELITHRSRAAERWIEGRPLIIIEDGVVRRALKDRLRITDQELAAALREHGVESAAQVKKAVVEPNGHVTVIKKRSGGA